MTSRDDEKKNLRKKAKVLRDQLDTYEAGKSAAQNFIRSIDLDDVNSVGIYYPFGSELDTLPLARQLADKDIQLALPVVLAEATPLEFRRWSPDEELVAGAYGIPAPSFGAEVVEPDMLVVPMLSFDEKGSRLGYGGGFYDRTLEVLRTKKNVTAVGFAYAGQEVGLVVTDKHDQPLDWVVTEKYVRKIQ